MKNNFWVLTLLLFSLAWVSCKSKDNAGNKPRLENAAGDAKPKNKGPESHIEVEASSKVYDALNVDQKAMVDFWKADVNGCNRYRDAENASALAKMLMDMKASETDVATLLGPPEENTPSGPFHVYGYYFDGQCDGKKLRPGTVYCLLQIYFDAKSGAWHTGTVICG